MKISVTGGLGFIGTTLVTKLREELDAEVVILDNLSNPSGDLEIGDRVSHLNGDIRDPDAIKDALEGSDAVVHLAAHTRVIESIEDPRINFDINVVGTFNILETMRSSGIQRFVGASTGGAILGEAEPPISEEMPAKPASPYGASKLAGEGYCWAYAQSYGLKAASLRFSNIYGPHSRHKSSVVAAFLKDILERGMVTVYGDGSQTRDYLFVEDLCDGIIASIQHGVEGVYQLGFGKPTSVNELIAIIRKVTGIKFDVDYQDFRAGEILHTYCNIEQARTRFGYNPATELADGVAKTWEWFSRTYAVGS